MNILVCAAEEIMMTAIEFRLQKHGFKLITAQNNDEAVQHLETGSIDLLVTDLKSDDINGIEAIRYVRQVMKSELPIIIAAEMNDEDEILDAIKEGANDFVIKPFKPAELIVRIKRIFQDIIV
jgi:DNA-binding response OmpR family regulator